jgi:Protein of unknown function (DUF3631)
MSFTPCAREEIAVSNDFDAGEFDRLCVEADARAGNSEKPTSAGNGSSGGIDGGAIAKLAALSRLEYDRRREEEAERLGVRVATLDREVESARKRSPNSDATPMQGRALSLPEPQPWHTPVDGAALLNEIAAAVRRYIVMLDHSADITALWVAHTYLIELFTVSPRLAVTSPEKGCGKTTLLDVLSRLVRRPLPTANVTTSAVFRVVEIAKPTLLIDEADTFLAENDELRGILNSGHRRGGTTHRRRRPRATAVLDLLRDRDRAHRTAAGHARRPVGDRRAPAPSPRRARDPAAPRSDRADLDRLAQKAARWATDQAKFVQAADPAMPAALVNRAADNWRPLLAIADVAGGAWPQKARSAAEGVTRCGDEQSARTQLLADIREVFATQHAERLSSGALVTALVAIEGRPWAEWRRGQPLTASGLAKLLRPFGIAPEQVRIGDRGGIRGYQLGQFGDALARYVPIPPDQTATPLQTSENRPQVAHSQPLQANGRVALSKYEKPNNDGRCSTVAAQKGGTGDQGTGGSGQPVNAVNGSAPADPYDIPPSCRRCLHCNGGGAVNIVALPDGALRLLHRECEAPWFAAHDNHVSPQSPIGDAA